MIKTIKVESFKSLQSVELELGIVNVFVGANGSGKSNLLEAIGVLSAAADGKVNDQTLLQRGVRPGVPQLYKSAFAAGASNQPTHISFSAASEESEYSVSLNNPLKDPSPAWKYKHERFESEGHKIASRGPAMKERPNAEAGLAALYTVSLKPESPARAFLSALQQYVIYAPTTSVLRGVSPETQPRQPLGISGGRLSEAVTELLSERKHSAHATDVCARALALIDWASNYGASPASSLPLSPSATATQRVVKFSDRFMKKDRNWLSGYDASEGALYVLFLAVLAAHPLTPCLFAVDNADHGLNPRLAANLMRDFSEWMLARQPLTQALITSHNPAVLDGLPLQDDRVRLFTVDRDNKGRTVVKRVSITPKLLDMGQKGWTLSRLWMNGVIGGMPNV
jgi:predicted ATPase